MRLSKFFRFAFLVLFLAIYSPVSGQNFGGNASGLRWRQIDTDTVRVIFPMGIENQAQRIANMAHFISKSQRESIGEKQKKIDIVLQNRTVISNGYVGLAPFRSELFLNAPQDAHQIGSNWLEVLTIHEYRHVLQFANARVGLTKFASYLTGQIGWSLMSHLSVPGWFWEGDAVMSETALTAQGRGRLPSFYNDYKSLWQVGRDYNYQKARNGSIKDFVPSQYHLGFLLCNYGRVTQGEDLWKNVFSDASRYRGLFYPFSSSLHKRTGFSTTSFYKEAVDYYKNVLLTNKETYSSEIQVNRKEKNDTFTSYEFPVGIAQDGLLALKQSFKKTAGIYSIDDAGKEELIVNLGRTIDNYFTYRNGTLAWAELGQDERWSWNTFSNIILYDVEKAKRRKLTSFSRYLSPDISPDKSKIVCFEYKPDNTGSLVIISTTDGKLLSNLANPEMYYYSYPKWSEDNIHLIVVARTQTGLSSIMKINTLSGETESFLPFTNHQIGVPVETKEQIYFSASYTGIDNIFAVDKGTMKIFQITDGELGSYHPYINQGEDTLYFSRFSAMGNDILKISLNKAVQRDIKIVEPIEMEEYGYLEMDKEGSDITDIVPNHQNETTKYSQTSGLINFHSWSWLFSDPNYEWALRSDNILNTMSMNVGVRYNSNEKNFTYFANASYAQLYPVFSIDASTTRRSLQIQDTDEPGDPVNLEYKWWETSLKGGVLLPLDLSAGLYKRSLSIVSTYSLKMLNYDDTPTAEGPTVRLNSIENGLSLINRRIRAKQNIFPKNSQLFSLTYKTSVDSYTAEQWHFDSEWIFAGLSPNHNLAAQVAYMDENHKNRYQFSDNFLYSRGYSVPFYDDIIKFSANYHAPLAYPDWGIWGIVYLYRLRSNVFFDYSRTNSYIETTNTSSTQLYNSAGLELIFDTRLFNYYDFSLGLRYAYLLNEDYQNPDIKNVYEVFIPVMRF